MFSKVWKAVKEVAIAVLLVLGIWYVGNKVYNVTGSSVQFGTLMDTVIAFSNLIMACAAIYAANEAAKWFQQKNKLNNLDSAHQKIKAYEDILWATHYRIFRDTAIRANFENDTINQNISIDEARNEVNSLVLPKTTTDLDELAMIYSEQARLKRYGINITSNFGEIIERIIVKRSSYLDLHYLQLVYIFATYENPQQSKVADNSGELNQAKIDLAKEYELILSNISLDSHYDLSSLK